MDEQNKEVERFSALDENNLPSLIDLVNKKYEAGRIWASASSIYNKLERNAEITLSRIMQEIRATQPPPEGKKAWIRDDLKDAARATKAWEEYVSQMDEAYDLLMDSINEKSTWESALEAVRTESVNARELSKIR